jgi:hypothetical protein
MQRILGIATVVGVSCVLSGCGGTASPGAATTSPGASSSQNGRGAGGAGRNGAQGELVKISGSQLVLTGQAGDSTVTIGDATTVQKTRTGAVSDIVAASCIVATGQKDATGAVTASTVRLSAKVSGSCAIGAPGGGNGAPRSPRPSGQAQPPASGGGTPPAFVAGEVTTVAGTAVTVRDTAGAVQSVIVPTTVRVSVVLAATTADLTVGSCVSANGSRDASGNVTATSLSIVPAGPSGCFSGAGGRGAGGRGGAAGGGAAGGGAPGGPPGGGAFPGA